MTRSAAPKKQEFVDELNRILTAATGSHIDVQAGDLHRAVGGYPRPFNRMPICCSVMKEELTDGDQVLYAPPSGFGPRLQIRYRLPRHKKAPQGRDAIPIGVDDGDRLNHIRRRLIHLLHDLDIEGNTPQEGLAAKIKRLAAHRKIPRRVSLLMLSIVELRNETEYDRYQPSAAEANAAETAWIAILEWAKAFRDRSN